MTSGGDPVAAELALRLRADLTQVAGANDDVERFLEGHGVPDRTLYAARLVVEEWLTNVVKYAYADADTALHAIDLHVTCSASGVTLRFEDDGRPFDPTAHASPAAPRGVDDATVGGLGLAMLRRRTRSLVYTRRGTRNIVTAVLAADDDGDARR